MKKVLILPAILALSATVFAQDANQMIPSNFKPTSVTKSKITCSDDYTERVTTPTIGVRESSSTGKVLEEIRTSWVSGNVEYRLAETTTFENNGKDIPTKGMAISKIVTEKNGDKVTETSQGKYVANITSEEMAKLIGKTVYDFDLKQVSVYQVSGNVRTLISRTSDDGDISQEAGTRETTTALSNGQKTIRYVKDTPFTYQDGPDKVEVLKSEMTCVVEDVK